MKADAERSLVLVKDVVKSISETHPMDKERLVFLNTSDIYAGRILRHEYSLVKDWPGQAKKSIRRNDILFSEIRPANGRYAFVDIEADDYVVSTKLLVLRTNTPELARYFYHFLTSKEVTAWLQHLAEARSGTFPQITFDHVASLQMPVPDSAEEREAIVATIDSLDDKLEQIRRTSRALEELAQAIFRAWFVEFEPIKAKAAGAKSFPSMSQNIFNSLPTSLVDSELGLIPKGWPVKAIGNSVTVRGGGTPSTKNSEYWEGGLHYWATPKDMSNLSDPIILETERRITDAGVQQISSGVLPVGTVLLSSRAPVGYLAIAGVPIAINQGFIAMVCDGDLPPIYVFHWTQSVMDTIKGRASGTTFPEISKSVFRPIQICVPDSKIVQNFAEISQPLFDLITANIRESRKLAELRDYLLPKLLGGKVRLETENA